MLPLCLCRSMQRPSPLPYNDDAVSAQKCQSVRPRNAPIGQSDKEDAKKIRSIMEVSHADDPVGDSA